MTRRNRKYQPAALQQSEESAMWREAVTRLLTFVDTNLRKIDRRLSRIERLLTSNKESQQ